MDYIGLFFPKQLEETPIYINSDNEDESSDEEELLDESDKKQFKPKLKVKVKID
jgi:hypothetical protein